jgi:hypothetical protein
MVSVFAARVGFPTKAPAVVPPPAPPPASYLVDIVDGFFPPRIA